MAQVEWIKLSTSTFRDEKIRLIKALPDGHALLIVWMQLLVQAGITNDGGYLYLDENTPYSNAMLAVIFQETQQTIDFALKTFHDFGMIRSDGKGIYIVNWEKHQNVEGMDKIRKQNRERKQKQRERQKLPQPPDDNRPDKPPDDMSRDMSRDGHSDVPQSHATELDLERDLVDVDDDVRARIGELNPDVKRDDPISLPHEDSTGDVDTELKRVKQCALGHLQKPFLDAEDIEVIQKLMRAHSIPSDTLIEALDCLFADARSKGKKINSVRYLFDQVLKYHAAEQQLKSGIPAASSAPAFIEPQGRSPAPRGGRTPSQLGKGVGGRASPPNAIISHHDQQMQDRFAAAMGE